MNRGKDGSGLGCEGSGTIVSVGEGLDSVSLIGKKVAFTSMGCWSQYKLFNYA